MGFEATRRVDTSARTFTIVEHLDHVEHARISEIARDLEMSKGIVHNHVSTLRELGYVTKRGPHYQLSAKLVHLGRRVRSHSPLYRAASSVLDTYTERVETGVLLVEQAGEQGIVIESYRLPASVELTVGTALPMSESLPGTVLLSSTDKPVSDLPKSRYDYEVLRSMLAEHGVATGTLTADETTQCVAAPVTDGDGDCYGSLAVIVPSTSDAPEALIESVATVRAQVETGLQGDSPHERSFTTEKHSWIDT